MAKIGREMSIVRILSEYPLAREAFKRNGIEFIGKDLSPLESLEKVGKGNGLSDRQIEKIVNEINKGIEEKGREIEKGEIIRLNREAEKELAGLVDRKKKRGIRLRLVSDGCGSYRYDMDFGTKKMEGEVEFQAGKVRFYLERKFLGMIKGTEISFQGEGFVFKNPNVREE